VLIGSSYYSLQTVAIYEKYGYLFCVCYLCNEKIVFIFDHVVHDYFLN